MDRDVGSRQELALLVRVPVDGEVDEVRPDAAVVEQGVPLARGAIAGDGRALALQPDKEIEDAALGLLHLGREAAVPVDVGEPEGLLGRPAAPSPKGATGWVEVPLVVGVHPQRSAVRRDLLDVEHLETVPGEDGGDGMEREVREVLVIDGVELVLVDEPQHVGELERDHPVWSQDQGHAGDEVVDIRNLSQHVVAEQEVGPPSLGRQLGGQLDPEEADQGRNAYFFGGGGDVGSRFDPEDGDAGLGRTTGAGIRRCWPAP